MRTAKLALAAALTALLLSFAPALAMAEGDELDGGFDVSLEAADDGGEGWIDVDDDWLQAASDGEAEGPETLAAPDEEPLSAAPSEPLGETEDEPVLEACASTYPNANAAYQDILAEWKRRIASDEAGSTAADTSSWPYTTPSSKSWWRITASDALVYAYARLGGLSSDVLVVADPGDGYKVLGMYQYLPSSGRVATYIADIHHWAYLCERGYVRMYSDKIAPSAVYYSACATTSTDDTSGFTFSNAEESFTANESGNICRYQYANGTTATVGSGGPTAENVQRGCAMLEERYPTRSDLLWRLILDDEFHTNTTAIYRLYNWRTSEHLYTSSRIEYNALPDATDGDWQQEGVAWRAPKSGSMPVYRLYNKVSGDHHYTTSAGERDLLVSRHGWTSEGVAFYSAAKGSARVVTVNRVYNGGLMRGQHHYTTSTAERDNLVRYHGWANEGVGFYGLK